MHRYHLFLVAQKFGATGCYLSPLFSVLALVMIVDHNSLLFLISLPGRFCQLKLIFPKEQESSFEG